MIADMRSPRMRLLFATLGASLSGCSVGGSTKGCQAHDPEVEEASPRAPRLDSPGDDGAEDPRAAELRKRAFDLLGGQFEVYVEVEDDMFVERIRSSSAPPSPTFEELRCPDGMVKIPGRTTPPLAPFCMSETMVTAAEYRRCVDAGRCTEPELNSFLAEDFATYGDASRSNHPMNYVDHEQAAAYCAFLGGLVPNEDEWLWAYGSAQNSRFPWGDSLPSGIETCTNDEGTMEPPMCPVRAYPRDRTEQGLYDVAGNLSEVVRTENSAFPRKLLLKPGTWAGLLAQASADGDTREETLNLLDIRNEDGTTRGLGFASVVVGTSGAGFRCVVRP